MRLGNHRALAQKGRVKRGSGKKRTITEKITPAYIERLTRRITSENVEEIGAYRTTPGKNGEPRFIFQTFTFENRLSYLLDFSKSESRVYYYSNGRIGEPVRLDLASAVLKRFNILEVIPKFNKMIIESYVKNAEIVDNRIIGKKGTGKLVMLPEGNFGVTRKGVFRETKTGFVTATEEESALIRAILIRVQKSN